LYQGDELGLSEARIPEDIPVEKIQDPFGQALYPAVPGRDGSRTPMPWVGAAVGAGFSSHEDTWLPIPEAHRSRAVDVQTEDPGSLLNTWRRLLHWRKTQPALMQGNCRILETEEPVFGFIRETSQQRLLCLFNLSADTAYFTLSDEMLPCVSVTNAGFTAKRNGEMLRLRGYSYFFGNLQPQRQPANSGSGRDMLEAKFKAVSDPAEEPTTPAEQAEEATVPKAHVPA
ncbi:MAG: hypothetical protein VKL39_18220, partial [Leptolyngbyaceae bacterium]|nr:hypothetical protein [Leptolyngbyaceae bacterium]